MSEEFIKGLEGITAAQSSICRIDGQKGRLFYRGYAIEELAHYATFEEVIYLLWYGELPTKNQLMKFKETLFKSMALPSFLTQHLAHLPRTSSPMTVLRTCISMLASYDPTDDEVSPESNEIKSQRVMALMPVLIAALWRAKQHQNMLKPKKELGIAGNFLYLLKGKMPTQEEVKMMDACLILHAEHGLNASTFAARVTVSTLSDLYSGIASAIGTLKGPLHGGANKKAIQAFHYLEGTLNIKSACEGACLNHVDDYVQRILDKHERIMGIGHRVYKVKDPRAIILEQYAKKVNDLKDYQVAKEIERVMLQEKNLYPNVDFFSGIVYEFLGIPEDLYVCIFALSRTAGWIAHILEQYKDNRLIRPRSEYIGMPPRTYVPLDNRISR